MLATLALNPAAMLGDRLLPLAAGREMATGTPAEILLPEVLERLFHARFQVVRGSDRPLTVLDLAS